MQENEQSTNDNNKNTERNDNTQNDQKTTSMEPIENKEENKEANKEENKEEHKSPNSQAPSSQPPSSQPPSIRETFGYVLSRVFERGQKELTKVAHESKERLLLRSLRKDRMKIYEKIGREVEQLILTGDIKHPGLENRIIKIRELEEHIEEVEKRIARENANAEQK
jgi:hypothetical protein